MAARSPICYPPLNAGQTGVPELVTCACTELFLFGDGAFNGSQLTVEISPDGGQTWCKPYNDNGELTDFVTAEGTGCRVICIKLPPGVCVRPCLVDGDAAGLNVFIAGENLRRK